MKRSNPGKTLRAESSVASQPRVRRRPSGRGARRYSDLENATAADILSGMLIPDSELSFKTSRSSGPGGQNVNKVETRVTLLFDPDSSPSLSDDQRARIHAAYPGRINKEGILRVTSSKHRSQSANRQAATERFHDLIAEALTPSAKRRRTRPPKKAEKKRLEEKRKRGEIKRLRRDPDY